MYEKIDKSEPILRKAIFESHKRKCAYCGDLIMPKNMEVDHILAKKSEISVDFDFNEYLKELNSNGFILDCVENYLPTCPSCNNKKNNRNFSISNLRFYHQTAINHKEDILAKMAKYAETDCEFPKYDPTFDSWEEIDFSSQRGIAYAISGYRLTSKDVLSCPRLKQVDIIKKHLKLLDYVVVVGEPGSGKSISIYQAAYDLKALGYKIYRFQNKKIEENIYAPILENEKLVLIIDDAQNLSQTVLEFLKLQANQNVKIIIATNQNNSSLVDNEKITITNIDSVNILAKEYNNRLEEIKPIVEQLDTSVGDAVFLVSLEDRIRQAEKSNTPEQFNYVLRGGWQKIRDNFQEILKHKRCALLLSTIAMFQILKVDKEINFDWLVKFAVKVDDTIDWDQTDLDYLIEKKFIISRDEVRVIHLESATRILVNFFKYADKSEVTILNAILEQGCLDNSYSILGLIWLFEKLIVIGKTYFITKKIVDHILNDISPICSQEERGYVVYFMERIISFNYHDEKLYYFNRNRKILIEWFNSVTTINAFEFSQLLNGLINADINVHNSFVDALDKSKLANQLSQCSVEKLYHWGNFFNRLTFKYNINECQKLSENLKPILLEKTSETCVDNIYNFILFLSSIYYLDPEFISVILSNAIDKLKLLFLNNIQEAVDLLDIHFMMAFCGEGLFAKIKRTESQKKISKQIVQIIPVKEFSNYISNSSPKKWRRIFEIMRLTYFADKKKANKIISAVNLSKNIYVKKALVKTDNDLHLLFTAMALCNIEKTRAYLRENRDLIDCLHLPFLPISPALTIELYNEGKKIILFENMWLWETLATLQSLTEVSKEETKKILYNEYHQFVHELENFCILDFNDDISLLEIFNFMSKNYVEILTKIVSDMDSKKVKKQKQSVLTDFRIKKSIVRKINTLLRLLAEHAYGKKREEILEIIKIHR